ncbi:MAG: response regulator [Pseudomonadota bacterium]
MRLLAVDDDASILELLTHILASFGYDDVVTAPSGSAAMDLLSTAKQPFDCLLLDVQMPEMNGIALCEEIRKMPVYRYAPIIMLTAMVQKQYIDKAFDAGASDYVTKPFEFDDLKQRLTDAHRMADERKTALMALDSVATEDGNATTVAPGLDLGDPLFFEELPNFFGLSEFENYVFKISTTAPYNSVLTAVKVENASELYKANDAKEFRKLMSAAGAEILSGNFAKWDFASYWGNGLFLIARDRSKDSEAHSIADKLTTHSIIGKLPAGSAPEFSFRTGDDISMRATSKLEAVFLIQQAVESVEDFAVTEDMLV